MPEIFEIENQKETIILTKIAPNLCLNDHNITKTMQTAGKSYHTSM